MSDWKTIESAPKDKVLLLVKRGFQPAVGWWTDRGWEYQDEGDFADDAHWDQWKEQSVGWEPTHWLDIPELPTE